MSNITDLYWEARGVSLHTHAWAIETFGGSRNTGPDKRGEDLVIPFNQGGTHVRKFRGPRLLELPMWIAPVDQDGNEDNSISAEAKMQQNWSYLTGLFDVEGQFDLTKRFYYNNAIETAIARAEVIEAPEPTVVANNTLRTVISVLLADPYFYQRDSLNYWSQIGTIDVKGDAPMNNHVHVSLAPGGRFTDDDGNWVQYNGTSGNVDLDMQKRVAKVGSQYVNGQISRNPNFPYWPTLKPGSNSLQGDGTVSYEPAFK